MSIVTFSVGNFIFALDRFSPANKSDEKAYQEWQVRLLLANRERKTISHKMKLTEEKTICKIQILLINFSIL